MQDTFNLGWKPSLVLRGAAKPELLDSYEHERRPIAEQVIWAASSLHEIFMAHGKNIGERKARIGDTEFLDAAVGRSSGLCYTYRDAVATRADAAMPVGPSNGDRAIDVALDNGQTLLAQEDTTRFGLIGIRAQTPDKGSLGKRLLEIAGRHGHLLEISVRRQSRTDMATALRTRFCSFGRMATFASAALETSSICSNRISRKYSFQPTPAWLLGAGLRGLGGYSVSVVNITQTPPSASTTASTLIGRQQT